MYSSETRKLFELYIHSLLFQVHAIDTLSKNYFYGSKTDGVDKKILNNTFISKYELLKNLKKFRTNKIQPLKRIYIPKNNNEKRLLSIQKQKQKPSILDRATQALVLSILDPIIEPHSDLYSFGFRKGRSNIMALSILQKNLQSKPVIETRTVDTQYI
jgi:RNA-directed DNA polymerase